MTVLYNGTNDLKAATLTLHYSFLHCLLLSLSLFTFLLNES